MLQWLTQVSLNFERIPLDAVVLASKILPLFSAPGM